MSKRSEMTLNYWMMVDRCTQNLKEEVGGANPGYEISSYLIDIINSPDGPLSLVLACWAFVSKKEN
jgi:hypothetical protein